ncbi:MAG: SUMF1/EgtB/PvdO family nonheme iron enzyme [Rhodospirillaceae bacterium]
MPSRFNLPHIDITPLGGSSEYVGSGSPFDSEARVRAEHGRRIQSELRTALRLADEARPTDPRIERPTGTFLEVELRRGEKADTLEAKKAGIRPGAVKDAANNDRTIALYVPDHARPVLEKVLDDYLNGQLQPKTGNPPQKDKVEAIEAIRVARLETFWTDQSPVPTEPQHTMWWALWCWAGSETAVAAVCARLGIRTAGEDRRLHFPEITVIPALASRAAIELLLFATDGIAELRRANDTPVFFTDDVRGEQLPWVDDLAARITWPPSTAPAVCIFDTGLNRGHALIEPAAAPADLHTLDAAWGVDDHDADGHGTSMAGTALHGDLTAALADTSPRTLKHRIESVKFLPPTAFDPNNPHSYGVLTQAAVARPEISAPERARVFCLAVSNEDISGAIPSSWSAAIDQAASGTMPGDTATSPKRLFVVAGGNTPAVVDYARLQHQDTFPIEDPAQAWNALTVGGYTDLINIQDKGYEHWNPLAGAGELSPHSRTSVTWPQGRSPFKPEIVMEGGNRAVNPGKSEILTVNSLSLLSTGKDIHTHPDRRDSARQYRKSGLTELKGRQMRTVRNVILGCAVSFLLGCSAFAADAAGSRKNTSPIFRDCSDCPEMIVLPPGKLLMDDSRPLRTAVIEQAFAIGRYEITYDEWDACVKDAACETVPDDGHGRGKMPVTHFTWNDLQSYVGWLSKKAGREYRLPTEEEWAYAANGGRPVTWWFTESREDQCKVGNFVDQAFNKDVPTVVEYNRVCNDGYGKRAAPVGSFAPNEFGIFDMRGNVAEVVSGCFGYATLTSTPPDTTAWTKKCELVHGETRGVAMGGSYHGGTRGYRQYYDPNYSKDDKAIARQMNSSGFRLAASVPAAMPTQPRAPSAEVDAQVAKVTTCLAEGGHMQLAGFARNVLCIKPYADAGKTCSDESECEGGCMFERGMKMPPAGQPAMGVCKRDNYSFGCRTYVKGGKVIPGPCVD